MPRKDPKAVAENNVFVNSVIFWKKNENFISDEFQETVKGRIRFAVRFQRRQLLFWM